MVKFTTFTGWIAKSIPALKDQWIAFTKDWGSSDIRQINAKDLASWLMDHGASDEEVLEAYQRATFFQQNATANGTIENRFFTSYESSYGKQKASTAQGS